MTSVTQEILQAAGQNLYVAAVCDVLDSMGCRNQAMHPRLRPLLPDRNRCGFVGRARTLRWMETDYVEEPDPYGLEIEAMDSLGPGDVIVHSTDRSGLSTPWGELMTGVAIRKKAVGCVCDSNIRDCCRIIDMGFPVFYSGIYPVDSRGRAVVKAFDVPVRCGDVLVYPGDVIFADYDGIVVIPKDVEQEVFALARAKVNAENGMRSALNQGLTLRQAYEKFGIL
jgi:regulator of RNase E activity RraA